MSKHHISVCRFILRVFIIFCDSGIPRHHNEQFPHFKCLYILFGLHFTDIASLTRGEFHTGAPDLIYLVEGQAFSLKCYHAMFYFALLF